MRQSVRSENTFERHVVRQRTCRSGGSRQRGGIFGRGDPIGIHGAYHKHFVVWDICQPQDDLCAFDGGFLRARLCARHENDPLFWLDRTGAAADILRGLNEATGIRNRGVGVRSGLYVLRKTAMPAVLVELAFISNPEEAALMRDRPDLFARGIYDGILDFTGV